MTSNVKIVTGPARCGKTQRLLDEYRGQLGASMERGLARCCWLGPNQTAIAQLQDRLLEGCETGLLSPNLFTFASFAESLIHRSPLSSHGIAQSWQKVRAITTAQKRRLLRHVIQAAVKQGVLQHFSLVAETPGFVSQLDETIAELKRSDVWPEAYQSWCEKRPKADRRNRELAQLYTAYQQQLHAAELYDAEGRFWAARTMLANSSVSSAGSASEQPYDLIVVSGFNDFTTAQYDILRLLAERSERLLISLTHEQTTTDNRSDDSESRLLFAKTRQTLTRLSELFPKLEIESCVAAAPKTNSLRQFQHQVFRELESADAEAGQFEGVEIVAANSEMGEIESLAQAIKSLLVKQTAQPEDIVLVHRGGEEAAARIASVFSDFGIPLASELRTRLETEPLVRALHSLLRLKLEDWPFQTLHEVIGNRLFARLDGATADTDPFETQPRVALEASLRSAQLPAGKDALLDQLEYRLEHASPTEAGGLDQRTQQLSVAIGGFRQLEEVLSALPERGSIAEWIVALEQLLVRLGTFVSTEARSREAAAWRCLRRGLREIERVDRWNNADLNNAAQSLELADVQELIVTAARDSKVPASHDAVGRGRVLSAESARKLTVKHLFLAGLNEQAFSGPSANPSVVVEQSEALGVEVPEDLVEPQATSVPRSDAMLLFYELVTRPTMSLTLSYPALDSKGQPLPPSPLLADLQRSVGVARISHRTLTLGQLSDDTKRPLSRGDFRRAAVEQALVGKPQWLAGMVSHPSFVRAGSSVLNGIDCVAQRAEREQFGQFEGLVHSDAARASLAERYNPEYLWSPSRLEGYAACPFRFFGEQLLKLEPLSELTLSNDARRRGSLLHQVLATIHEQLSRELLEGDSGEAASDADYVAGTDELVSRFLAALDAEVKARPLRGIDQSLREIERREIEAWAPSYAEQERQYRGLWDHLDEPPRPMHFEVRFGPESRSSAGELADRASTVQPFELELGDERILLTGQIDRVDIGQVSGVTVFNIIDYKSGKEVKLKHEKVRSGHQLQLPLYALAAERLLLADQQAVGLATGYWNIRGKGFQTKNGGSLQLRELGEQSLKPSDEWQNLQPDILVRVQELVRGIRQGDFPVYNEDEQCTRSCELSTICRVAQIRSLEKQWPPSENDC